MRLIDADALKACLFNGGKNFDRVHGDRKFILGVETAIEAIDYAPTIDTVKHGKWHNRKFDTKCSDRHAKLFGWYECSCCTFNGNPKWNFCPHCGARMDGDGE